MISIVMTTYNSEKFIKEQIDSIFNEKFNDFEIVVCDDVSSDATVEIIKGYNDSRIKLFINEKNLGAVRNLENAISKANGDIVVICDSDNVWLNGKLDNILPLFEDKKISMVMHDAFIVDEHLNITGDSYFAWRKSKPGLFRNIIKNGYGGSMIAFRSTMKKYILHSPKKLGMFYDEWIGMMCSKHGKVKFVNEKYLYWRRHSNATSSASTIQASGVDKSKQKKRLAEVKWFFAIFADRVRKIWLACWY